MNKRGAIECTICVEPTTPSLVVVCPFCDFRCCKTCFTRVILDDSHDAHCMNCKRRFDREMMLSLTSAKFVNVQYKAHRERLLLEREVSMIPATMPYVELERNTRVARDKMATLMEERRVIERRLVAISHEITTQQNIARQTEPNMEVDSAERRVFTQRCTHENCRGWLNTAYRCGVCSVYSCSKCLVPCGDTRVDMDAHVCNPEDIDTVKAIRLDSTPCPSCGIRISKVSGCSQMWCVQCHCSFDYNNGKRINGIVHNPHWFLYQQQNTQTTSRDLADIPCGAMPSIRELHRVGAATHTLCQAMRIVAHIQAVELRHYNARPDIVNRKLRVRYIMGDLEEDAFKCHLQRHDKVDAKNNEVTQVLEMFCHTVTDELRQVALRAKPLVDGEDTVRTLVIYTNTAMDAIASRYNQKTPKIYYTFEIRTGVWDIVTRRYPLGR